MGLRRAIVVTVTAASLLSATAALPALGSPEPTTEWLAPPSAAALTKPMAVYSAVWGRTRQEITPYPLATNRPGLRLLAEAEKLLFSPDAATLFAVGSSVTALDPATGAIRSTTTLPARISDAAITPNGNTIWLTYADNVTGTGWIRSYATGSGNLGPTVFMPPVIEPFETLPIVIAPDARTAYLGFLDGVHPFDLATRTFGRTIALPEPVARLAISPNGKTLFASTDDLTSSPLNSALFSIVLATGAVTPGRRLADFGIQDLEVSADGTVLWATQANSEAPRFSELVGYSTATNEPVSTHRFGYRNKVLAVVPDGTAAYVGVRGTTYVERVALATDARTLLESVGNWPTDLAITPAQPPVAAFTATARPHGQATTFDGAGSQGASANVVKWSWQFGDGTSTSRTTPTVTHTYAAAGTYTVTLTVTDAMGTSTTRVFNGTEVVRNGRPVAKTRRTVVIP